MKKYLFLILVCLLSGCKEEMTENSLCEKIGKELNRALPFRTSIMHSENTGSGQCTFWTKSNKNQKFFYDALFFDDSGCILMREIEVIFLLNREKKNTLYPLLKISIK